MDTRLACNNTDKSSDCNTEKKKTGVAKRWRSLATLFRFHGAKSKNYHGYTVWHKIFLTMIYISIFSENIMWGKNKNYHVYTIYGTQHNTIL